MPSVLEIQNSITDDKDLVLLKAVACKNNNMNLLTIKSTLSKKQYYSRLSRFIKACLIKKDRGQYRLTPLGILVMELLEVLEFAVKNYSGLIPIDDNSVSPGERIKLVETLIDNQILKQLIIQGYSRIEGHQAKEQPRVHSGLHYPINIILVENDPDTLTTFEIMLKTNGFNVKGFLNPYQALNYFIHSGSNCDFVISDIRLPRLNGIQLCQKINKIDPRVKVIYITGLDAIDEISSATTDINLVGILKKPIEEENLINVIRTSEVEQLI